MSEANVVGSIEWLVRVNLDIKSYNISTLQSEIWPKVWTVYISNYLLLSTEESATSESSLKKHMILAAEILNYCFITDCSCNWLAYCDKDYSKVVLSITNDLLSMPNLDITTQIGRASCRERC